MIEILTWFMWLTSGPQQVALGVSGPVAAVEIRLDGEQIGELRGQPWSFQYDFGRELRPRQLLAIARDVEGRELDRAVRWINLGISTADAQLDFETDKGRVRVALLSWESIGAREPETVELSFDGEKVPVSDPRRVVLPPYEEGSMHSVVVTLRFSGQREVELSAIFGGSYGEEVTAELTAVPVVLEGGRRLPKTEQLGSWFSRHGEALQVHAVEKDDAEVIVVRDPAAGPYFESMAGAFERVGAAPRRATGRNREVARQQVRLKIRRAFTFAPGIFTRFLSPFAMSLRAEEEVSAETFSSTPRQAADQHGLLWLSHRHRSRDLQVWLADAVALAGMEAQASGRRRAVILILGGQDTDSSQHDVAHVREYLRRLQVPLYVWSMVSADPHPEWGEVRYIGFSADKAATTTRLAKAVREVSRDLDDQRVVWIRGRLLPQEIELSGGVSKVRLAGASWTDQPQGLGDPGGGFKPDTSATVARDREDRELQPRSDDAASTALLIQLTSDRELPAPEAMSSWFRAGGEPAPVERVETGTAEVVILRGPASLAWIDAISDPFYEEAVQRFEGHGRVSKLEGRARQEWRDLDPAELTRGEALPVEAAQERLRSFATLGPGVAVRFVSPLAAAPSRVDSERRVFHFSRRYAADVGGFLWLTQAIPSVLSHFRLADALEASARQLHASAQRRALVVLLGQSQEDKSLYEAARVKAALAELQVPVVVWSFGPSTGSEAEWGEVVNVRLDKSLDRAARRLRARLGSQRIVWIRGRHSPSSIELSAEARGLCLVGRCEDPQP